MSFKSDNLSKGILAGIRAYEGLSMAGGGLAALAQGGVTRMAEGGNPYSYEYDPVLQRYVEKKTTSGPKSVADPGGFESDLLGVKKKPSEGDSVTADRPLTKEEKDWWDWVENTPEGRAYQEAKGAALSGLLARNPLNALFHMITGTPLPPAPDLSVLVGTPQAYKDYQAAFQAGMNPVNGPGTIGSRDLYGSNETPPGATTTSDLGPGTLGSRDTYGSNESPSAPDSGFSDVGGLGAAAAADAEAGGYMAKGGLAALARGGFSHLGDYSDGGRLLRGPGDGVSDSIPATIGQKRPARLADGEFVVPARIVSELGNGSTEAGARKLYAMMERIQQNRSKTVGKGKVAVNSRSDKALPA